jgi:F-box protein 11
VSNSSVSFNGKCGILVEKGANPHIFKNIIEKNLGQGILLTEGSSAFIEKNEICSNIKANIALGGRCSINTTIIENKIRGGKCEGIFTIYGERLLITNNEISRNNQGIVAVTSVPRIEGNTISLNETNGVLLVRDC